MNMWPGLWPGLAWNIDYMHFVLIAAVLDRGPEKTLEIPIADTYYRTYVLEYPVVPSRGADRPTRLLGEALCFVR